MINKKCAIYARVSKNDESQNPQNQIGPLKKLAGSFGMNVVETYIDFASGGSTTRPQFRQMLKDARVRKFETILVWSLDRFSREGMNSTLSYLEDLKKNRVSLKSLQESWLDTSDEGMGELLIAIFSWVAKQERGRISERTKAGLSTAKANGKRLGRPTGSKDKSKRKTFGYLSRWANGVAA